MITHILGGGRRMHDKFPFSCFFTTSALCGSLHTSYGGCVNVPTQSKHAKVSTAPFSVRTVPAKYKRLSLALAPQLNWLSEQWTQGTADT